MTDIALRVFAPYKIKHDYPKNTFYDRIFVFDTETTTDEYQNLKFGSFAVYADGGMCNRGIFYNPKILNESEIDMLINYSAKNGMRIYTLTDFIRKIFYRDVYYKKALCIGFNLPFDLSRLATSFNSARRKMKGGFSFKLSENPRYPHIRIKHVHSKLDFIKFGQGFDGSGRLMGFEGNFLDLHSLAFSMTNKDMSLKSACEHFKTKRQKSEANHGNMDESYIDYNINDTLATYDLYTKLLEEYEKFNLKAPLTEIYSAASIGKACLKTLGIKPFMEQNPDFPKDILGYVMTSYYGGRSEVKIRKQPTKIVLMDFLSMYPTVCVLQNLWRFIIAEKIEFYDNTEDTKKLLEKISLGDLKNKDFWPNLCTIVEIVPDNDILPVRCRYEGKNTFNIGVNYLNSDKHLFYTLADVISSKLLTGKCPKVIRSIRFVPKNYQSMLKSAIIAGLKIDPKKQDFFKLLIEERQRNAGKKDVLKTIANSTSYGIFIEINPENEKSKINAYGLEKITTNVNKIESLGYYFNPIVAIFITSAAKLVLACTETILNSHGTVHAFCDTDSMAVPKEYHKEIQDFFRSLNPYDFDKPLFKIEKENFGSDGQLKDLWFYGISAKRYVLYNMENNKIIIRKHSSHGLGHILNPFDKKINWEEEFWMDILKEHYGMISKDELRSKYSSFYAISKITVSNANILKRLSKINKNQPLEKQIKPFNFVLIGFGMKLNDKQTDIIKPLAPFCSSPQEIAYRDFIDYKSGRTHNGLEYWKPMDIVFFDYIHHKEAKSDGNVGILQRKSVICDQITYIGKESTSLDTTGIIDKPNYVEYVSNNPYAYKLLQMTPKDVKRYGIARNTLWYMKKRAKSGKFRVSKRVERGLFRAMEVK